MPITTTFPLAKAIVSVEGDLSDWKKQVSDLRKEAKAFGILGRELNKFSNDIFKFVVLPLTAIGTLGVRKFLQTTETGAALLRGEIYNLTKAWNQFLARVGEAIVQNTMLGKVIQGLSKFLGSLDTSRIRSLIDITKWAFLLFVMTKLPALALMFYQNMLKTEAALKSILGMQTAITSLSVPVGASVGAGVAAGAAGAAGFNLAAFGAYEMSSIKQIMERNAAKLGATSGEAARNAAALTNLTSSANAASASLSNFGKVGMAALGGLWAGIKRLAPLFVSLAALLAIITAAFEFIAGFLSAFGNKMKALDLLMWVLEKFTLSIRIISAGLYALGALIGDIVHGRGLSLPATTRAGNELIKLWGELFGKKDKNKEYQFGAGNIQQVGFADLNRIAQETAFGNPLIDNTEATKENTLALKENTWKNKGSAGLAFGAAATGFGMGIATGNPIMSWLGFQGIRKAFGLSNAFGY